MRQVPLSRGMSALVDDADYDRVMAMGRWCADPGGTTFYARKNLYQPGRKLTSLLMHAFLTGWSRVDHINGNGLDNRRANLRPATHAQNMRNKPMYRNNRSGFKGVYRRKNRWCAQIKHEGKLRHLGSFAAAEEAARAYDIAARELFGEFARPNFPTPPEESTHV